MDTMTLGQFRSMTCNMPNEAVLIVYNSKKKTEKRNRIQGVGDCE